MNLNFNIKEVDFQKDNGLVPAIIQDERTLKVLMLGFLNEEALQRSVTEGVVTFYSRSKKRLWTKGETSGNFLKIKTLAIDCDKDTLLIKVEPVGPVCHTGADTCWDEINENIPVLFLNYLENIIKNRRDTPSVGNSYTASLFAKGINKIAQKVGEEAVELVIEAKDDNRELFLGEAADLLFHYLILLSAKNFELKDVIEILNKRHK